MQIIEYLISNRHIVNTIKIKFYNKINITNRPIYTVNVRKRKNSTEQIVQFPHQADCKT